MKTIAILGGGPAGYAAAITAARQGKEVLLIEEKELGGTCLNEGCMPTKSLLQSAETFDRIRNAARFGIDVNPEQVSVNWAGVLKYKQGITQQLQLGVSHLLKKNKVTVIKGKARFLTDRQVEVTTAGGTERIAADSFLIATGSESVALANAPFDGRWVLDSHQALSLPAVPSSLLIIGGGVIGCEFASIFSRFGTRVTLVELASQLLPGEDEDIAAVLQRHLQKAGVQIHTKASLAEARPERKEALIQTECGSVTVSADYMLVAVGRRPRVNNFGLEEIGVRYTPRGIAVNEQMQTNIPHLYACGDVIGGIQLAHVAFHEGITAALNACGVPARVRYNAVPRCIYTEPEIASVGLTEKQAIDRYGDIRKGEFPFAANGKALILQEAAGKVKVLVEPKYQEIVGVSIVGPRATELIGQASLMLHAELTADVLESAIAAHPTLSEALQEALLNATSQALHG